MPKDIPHVAFHLSGFYGGGAERVMVNLTQSFVKRGIKVDLLVNAITGPYLPDVPLEARVIETSKNERKSLSKLMHYLRQEQPQAMLACLHYCAELAILAKRFTLVPTRVVVAEQNHLSVRAQRAISKRDRLVPLAARLCYPWADGIVTVSQGVAEDLARTTGLPLERIQVIFNPVIAPEISEKAKEGVDHPWFAQGEPPVILGVGRLEPQKDFPTLIRAFAQVRQVCPARLMILGSGNELLQLKTLIGELGLEKDVELPGFVKNPYAYIAHAATFVLSSAWEGLPTVLIEAMAVGTPVVATACPSGPSEILDNGKYGALVPVGDDKAIAEAILSILSGNSKSVDPNWINQFTIETATQRYLEVMGLSQTV